MDETEKEIDSGEVATEEAPPEPETIRLNEYHQRSLPQLQQLALASGIRHFAGLNRHQIISQLVRTHLNRGNHVWVDGVLDAGEPHGMLRYAELNFLPSPEDVLVPSQFIKRHFLRPGHRITAWLKPPRDRERHTAIASLETIEGVNVDDWEEPKRFDQLTALFPDKRLILEIQKEPSISGRFVDLISPLGLGQRGLIVAPPRVGKTILLKNIAKSIRRNYPEIRLIILLLDERPEEVTDFRRDLDAEVYSSTFDEPATRHVQVAEMVSERAKRLVELGQDVVILLDSITRLARGYNAMQSGKGRIMSGGVEAKALIKPKRFFGAARNVEEGGSLTILATALVETESRMDEVIFEEFKGTGNMELHLDRGLVEKRVFPAIHMLKSGTRKDDLLYHPEEFQRINLLRKRLAALPPLEATEVLIKNLKATRTNTELLLTGLH